MNAARHRGRRWPVTCFKVYRVLKKLQFQKHRYLPSYSPCDMSGRSPSGHMMQHKDPNPGWLSSLAGKTLWLPFLPSLLPVTSHCDSVLHSRVAQHNSTCVFVSAARALLLKTAGTSLQFAPLTFSPSSGVFFFFCSLFVSRNAAAFSFDRRRRQPDIYLSFSFYVVPSWRLWQKWWEMVRGVWVNVAEDYLGVFVCVL